MALSKEIMGSSILERSSFIPSKNLLLRNRILIGQDQFLVSRPKFSPLKQRKLRSNGVVMAAISEDLLDALRDKIGRNVALELVSTEIDPKTRGPRTSSASVLKDWSKKTGVKAERVNYTAEFMVDSNFGVPGAILVTNRHQQEFFLESITLEGFACGPVHFPCNSWVQSKKDLPGNGKRMFFFNKVMISADYNAPFPKVI
ncbi:hypothetical protein Ancab_011936 [Ancistrocladus abbreviatus]